MSNPDFDRRNTAALSELNSAGITRRQSHPPLLRLLGLFGIKSRPLQYQGFTQLFLSFGVFFGIFWGLVMYFILWHPMNYPLWICFAAAALAGILFGLLMALAQVLSGKRKKLSRWSDL
jgi:hypothetical protein